MLPSGNNDNDYDSDVILWFLVVSPALNFKPFSQIGHCAPDLC